MTKTWVIADTHFGHAGVCRFTREDGSPLRPWDDPSAMDTALVNNWNELVHPEDRVYILGDLCINRSAIPTVGRCNGRKVLVKGNHDIFKLKDYLPYFDDIRAYVVKPKLGIIMSHVPIHPASLGERFALNIHGHLHANRVLMHQSKTFKMSSTNQSVDPRYLCVSVEQTDYKPVDLQEIIDRL